MRGAPSHTEEPQSAYLSDVTLGCDDSPSRFVVRRRAPRRRRGSPLVTRRLVRPSAALFVPNKRKKVSVEYLKTWFFFDFIMVVLRFHYHSRGVEVAWDGGDFSYWCAPRRRGAASRSAAGPTLPPCRARGGTV